MRELLSLFGNQKYRKIIILTFLSTLIIVLSACYELYISYHAEIERAEIQSSNLSQVIEEQLSATIKKVDLVMLELARTVREENPVYFHKNEEIDKLFMERKNDLPEAGTFSVADHNGHERYSSRGKVKVYIGDRDYFQALAKSQKDVLLISRPLLSKVENIPTIYLARRMTDKHNNFIGVITTGIPISFFSNLYANLNVGKKGAITLLSNEDILYARYPHNEKMIGEHVYVDEVIGNLFKKNNQASYTIVKSPIDGVERYTSARRIDETKLFIAVGISKDEVLAGWKIRVTFYCLGFLILWTGCIVYLINFLKSLQELDERRKIAIQTAKLSSLGEMAAGIAHEINNPLTVISTRATHLKRLIERDQYDPESFRESLTKINQTVDRIAKIIKGLKSFSRNAENDNFISTPLKTIVENALELCNERFRHKMVDLRIDAIPALMIDCREAQMVQVLLNLLNNAFDAVSSLEDKWIQVSFVVQENGKLIIKVIDSGHGISKDTATKIMQPFFTTKEVGKGTGLGLSISKGIVEDHKGQLSLDFSCKNTCFEIQLPVQPSEMEVPIWRMSS